MSVEKLLNEIKSSKNHSYVYHFTDSKNLKEIASRGILSKNDMKKSNFWPEAPGGNEWSWGADDRKGLGEYVSLCFTVQHPMSFVAEQCGRISSVRYICIDPKIILQDGVLFATDIANKSGIELIPIGDAVKDMDIEVLYRRTDWRNEDIKQRLKIARKYELLIPRKVPRDLIVGLAAKRK